MRVPWWSVVSAGLAPVFLIGGWTVAASRQPPAYDSVRDTISALAGLGATDRWIMTIALAGLGACHVVTALGLRPASWTNRATLALGGVATVLVAAFPVPAVGASAAHGRVAAVALTALALWPVCGARPGRPVPWGLRLPAPVTAAAVLVGLLALFALQLAVGGGQIGLTERLLAGAEALWPLVVVLTARRDSSAIMN